MEHPSRRTSGQVEPNLIVSFLIFPKCFSKLEPCNLIVGPLSTLLVLVICLLNSNISILTNFQILTDWCNERCLQNNYLSFVPRWWWWVPWGVCVCVCVCVGGGGGGGGGHSPGMREGRGVRAPSHILSEASLSCSSKHISTRSTHFTFHGRALLLHLYFLFWCRIVIQWSRAPSQYKDRLIYVWRFQC